MDPWSAGYNAAPGSASPFGRWTRETEEFQSGQEYAAADRALAPKPGRFEPDELEELCTP